VITARRRGRGERVLLAADGVPVLARHSAPTGGARELAFVVAHGFTGSSSGPVARGMARVLARAGGVVAFDFRGHGGSGGHSTVGDLEVLDLAAAAGWARLLGYRRIVPVGFSLGASVAVRHAAFVAGTPDAVDAVVAVSGPSRWHYRGTQPLRLLHRGIETSIGRRVLAAGFGTRVVTRGWDPWPEPPDALAGRLAPAPLLVVHGDADRYFPLDHARWLVEAARGPVELWVERGFGHAEAAATPELVERVAAWVLQQVGSPAPTPQ
jgi:pimeloyl-ACP methyl ester carboxylesterase